MFLLISKERHLIKRIKVRSVLQLRVLVAGLEILISKCKFAVLFRSGKLPVLKDIWFYIVFARILNKLFFQVL